jgi:hypothetical protein
LLAFRDAVLVAFKTAGRRITDMLSDRILPFAGQLCNV